VHTVRIYGRDLIEVNTDPQRRCYDGCHARSEWHHTEWKLLVTTTSDKAQESLDFWQSLNEYAVSQRGESARSEYKIEAIE
jgi:hypothetical protein